MRGCGSPSGRRRGGFLPSWGAPGGPPPLIASLCVDRLVAFGAGAAQAARGAQDGGMSGAAIDHTTDRERLRETVRGSVAEGDGILGKGSRGRRVDEVVEDILEVLA